MGTPPPPKRGGAQAHIAHHFLAHVYCGQMHGWMDQGAIWYELDLGPSTLCKMWTQQSQLPSKRGTTPPFSAHVYCGQTAGCINRCHLVRRYRGLGAGHIVLDGDPSPRKGAQQPPPTFRPMSIAAKRSPISATAELLSVVRHWKI